MSNEVNRTRTQILSKADGQHRALHSRPPTRVLLCGTIPQSRDCSGLPPPQAFPPHTRTGQCSAAHVAALQLRSRFRSPCRHLGTVLSPNGYVSSSLGLCWLLAGVMLAPCWVYVSSSLGSWLAADDQGEGPQQLQTSLDDGSHLIARHCILATRHRLHELHIVLLRTGSHSFSDPKATLKAQILNLKP